MSSVSTDSTPSAAVVITPPTVATTADSLPALVAFNVNSQVPLKLTSKNYAAWRIQFNSLLFGYNLYGYIDGSLPCPPTTIIPEGSTSAIPNPAYLHWFCQDQLILNAIVGSLSATLIPFISASKTSNEAWTTLLKAYATPSRGRIQQYRSHLNNPKLGNRTITDYMHEIKGNIDALALMNVIIDFDELYVRILDGLDSRYEGLANAIHAREQPITFDELLEKLLNHEANLKAIPTPADVTSPVTTMAAPVRSNPRNQNRGGSGSH